MLMYVSFFLPTFFRSRRRYMATFLPPERLPDRATIGDPLLRSERWFPRAYL
jgi:hypothetical protein